VGTPGSRGAVEGGIELSEGLSIEAAERDQHSAAATLEKRRFFGRRKGRKLTQRQSLLLSGKLAALSLDPCCPAGSLDRLFSEPVGEVWLEIGFGAGEHLASQAVNNPNVGLIGAEPFVNGVVAALSAIEQHQLESRVRLHASDVVPLLEWLPGASISRAFMLFPDPWPKKRHRERRLLSASLLDQLARLMKVGAEFRFASDIVDYAEAAQALVKAHSAFEIALVFTSGDRDRMADWPITRYEVKANSAGRTSTFLVIRRNGSSLPPRAV
jgi:tRNA (guanine-N7-)-methyltransferase